MAQCARDGSPLKNTLFRGVAVGRCPDCMGVWVDGKELATLVGKLSNEANPQAATHATLGQTKPGALACPQCAGGVHMMAVTRQGAEIDVCPQCRSVWMDKGEIDRAFPGRAGNTREPALAGAGVAAVAAGAAAFTYLPMEEKAVALTEQHQGTSSSVTDSLISGAGEIATEGAADLALGLIGALFEGIFS